MVPEPLIHHLHSRPEVPVRLRSHKLEAMKIRGSFKIQLEDFVLNVLIAALLSSKSAHTKAGFII